MPSSSQITEDLLSMMSRLWDALESEGVSLSGRILEVKATDRFKVVVGHRKAPKGA